MVVCIYFQILEQDINFIERMRIVNYYNSLHFANME